MYFFIEFFSVLFLFIRNEVYLGGANIENLEKEFPPIQAHVEECIEEVGEEARYYSIDPELSFTEKIEEYLRGYFTRNGECI